jgi:hypothetical protein
MQVMVIYLIYADNSWYLCFHMKSIIGHAVAPHMSDVSHQELILPASAEWLNK